MTAAHLYFALMVLGMLPLTVVHLLCREIVARHPQSMLRFEIQTIEAIFAVGLR